MFIAGDFNIGLYGVCQCLLNFMIQKDLYACNTSLNKQSARHITSWHGTTTARYPDSPDKTVKYKYWKQIEHVLCKSSYKVNITYDRSYGGALLKSDHKPVVACIMLNQMYLFHKKHKTSRDYKIMELESRRC